MRAPRSNGLRSRSGVPRRGWLMALPVVCAVAGLGAGTAAYFLDKENVAGLIWSIGVLPVLAVLLLNIVRSLRRGDVGLDLVAALSMTAALFIGEALAAAVVALMYAGGQVLEAFAAGRASREMNALMERVPRTAVRYAGEGLSTIPISEVAVGDRLLVHLGDVLPVDGTVSGTALLNEAPLTGESLPVTRRSGEAAMSGSTNVGAAFDLIATETAARSTYAGIVLLVEEATRSEAPMTRLADRYALAFMLATLGLAATAWWLSGDPVRAVAVLVVATPCPLILAVPIAIVAGISRAATAGVLVKGGAALEALGGVRTLVVDKTGTLTHGAAAVSQVIAANGWSEDEVLRLAASLDQASQHAVAKAVVAGALRQGLALELPSETQEAAGEGVDGTVAGRQLRVGGKGFVSKVMQPGDQAALMRSVPAGALTVALAVDGAFAGLVLMRDQLRSDVGVTLARLRRLGVTRMVLATGDRRDVATAITADLGLDEIAADLLPEDKITLVRRERARAPVMMVGDGVNDAPALVTATIGVAMGAKGAAASAEAADVILLRDSLEGLVEAVAIAQRSRRIALQSVVAGIGLSGLGMFAAALGYLSPVHGALFQEAIDIAVIFNALRALRTQ